ncbi:MAG: hypothetical protein WC749_05715 [Dehalococcoidia bacterium]
MAKKFWLTAPANWKQKAELEALRKKKADQDALNYDAGMLSGGKLYDTSSPPPSTGPTNTPGGIGRVGQPQASVATQAHAGTGRLVNGQWVPDEAPQPPPVAPDKGLLQNFLDTFGKMAQEAPTLPRELPRGLVAGLNEKFLGNPASPTSNSLNQMGQVVAGLIPYKKGGFTREDLLARPDNPNLPIWERALEMSKNLGGLGPQESMLQDIATAQAMPGIRQALQGVKGYPKGLAETAPRLVGERVTAGMAKKIPKKAWEPVQIPRNYVGREEQWIAEQTNPTEYRRNYDQAQDYVVEKAVVPVPARPSAPAVPSVAVKEPWQMTNEEWTQTIRQARQSAMDAKDFTTVDKITRQFIDQSYGADMGGTGSVNQGHRFAVQKAISEGRPVPPEVLAEYGLTAKVKEAIPGPTGAPRITETAWQRMTPEQQAAYVKSGGVAPAAESAVAKGALPTVPTGQARAPQAPVSEAVPPVTAPVEQPPRIPGDPFAKSGQYPTAGQPPRPPVEPPVGGTGGTVPPRKGRATGGTGGGSRNTGPVSVTPGPQSTNVIGLRRITPGLIRREAVGNVFKGAVNKPLRGIGSQGFVKYDPMANAAMRERSRVQTAIESNANVLGTKSQALVENVFKVDKQGRITSLAGVDPSIPGGPTIQDVAARLPTYQNHLTPEQLKALSDIQLAVGEYRTLLSQTGVEVASRPDVLDGGFYLPRGRADVEGADLPIKIGSGMRGSKKGFEKPAVFESQAAGIDAGYKYSPLGEAIGSYSKDAGVRATDAHVANYFKALTDEEGKLIGTTPKTRLQLQNPAVALKMEGLKKQLGKLQDNAASLSKRQQDVIFLWQNDPQFDDLDTLLQGLGTMKAGRAGRTGPEIIAEINKTKAIIRDLAPEYKTALKRAQLTPREEGIIGLPGLQGWTFPDEIANAANVILNKQGATRGALSPVINTLNAFNNLYRGMRATLDNSAMGIQGLLGLGAQPKAYAQALKVNMQAWGIGGDKILGKYLVDFDQKVGKIGRATSSDWSRAGLHLGGATSEFQLGQGVTSKIGQLPVVRQANRAFGYLGDTLRLEWADAELATQLRNRTLADITASGDLERIAGAANNMTGWARNKTFGSAGDMLLFAPRFLQSRLETVAKAGLGLRPGAALDERMARNAMLRLIGWGTVATVGINYALGNETDFRPVVDGRRNSNFMRVKYQGRSYSLFGTWDSLLGVFINVGTGHPQNALRAMGSGIVSDGWDLISGYDFNYDPTRDSPEDFAKWVGSSMVPFVAQDVPDTLGQIGAGVEAGDLGKVGGGTIALGSQVVGVKSYVLPTGLEKVRQDTADEFKKLPYVKGLGIDLGSVGVSDNNIPLTDEQRIVRQTTLGAVVTPRMKGFLESPDIKKLTTEKQKEKIQDELARIKGMLEKVYNHYGIKDAQGPLLPPGGQKVLVDMSQPEVERYVLEIESLQPYQNIQDDIIREYGNKILSGTETLNEYLESIKGLKKKARDAKPNELPAIEHQLELRENSATMKLYAKRQETRQREWRQAHPEAEPLLWKWYGIKPTQTARAPQATAQPTQPQQAAPKAGPKFTKKKFVPAR